MKECRERERERERENKRGRNSYINKMIATLQMTYKLGYDPLF